METGLEAGSGLDNIIQQLLHQRDNENNDDQDGVSDLIGEEDIKLTDALNQKSERAVASAVASGQVHPDVVMRIAETIDESSLASTDDVIHEAVKQQLAIPQRIDPDAQGVLVLTALESWAKACSSGIQCLEAQQIAITTVQPQEGTYADLSMISNAERGSHNNVIYVKWWNSMQRIGKQAHVDEDMGIKYAMNTIPPRSFADWQIVHPAIGTVMLKTK